jgi:hypothetical protein
MGNLEWLGLKTLIQTVLMKTNSIDLGISCISMCSAMPESTSNIKYDFKCCWQQEARNIYLLTGDMRFLHVSLGYLHLLSLL